MSVSGAGIADSGWRGYYKVGGIAALLAVLTGLAEIAITFLPGGYETQETILDWFMLFQRHTFMGLRNLGLLNIVMVALGLLISFALYAAHRRVNPPYATLALILSILAAAVFYATNRAFAVWDLSNQYAAATSENQRLILTAAGQAMLSVGQSHTPGTFLAFLFSELSSILMALVMLRGGIFSKASAYAGLLGFSLLLIYEVCVSFLPDSRNAVLVVAMLGGISTMVWYVLVARRLFQLGEGAPK